MLAPLLLAALALLRPAAAECPAGLATLRAHMGEARMAYALEDLEGLRVAVLAVDEDLTCLEDVVSPEDALQAHITHVLGWWLLRDEARVVFAMRGVLAIDPDFQLGDDIAPPGTPLMVIFSRLREQDVGMSAPLDRPLILDGFRGVKALPVDRAVLIQREGVDGVETWYSAPDGPPSAVVRDPPWGWLVAGSILMAVPEQIAVLRDVRRLADGGRRPSKIADRLNFRGKTFAGEPWTAASVERQLSADEEGALRRKPERVKAAEKEAGEKEPTLPPVR
jgi:hypothetical protein